MTSWLVLDIDGTICFDGLSIDARIVEAVHGAHAAGWRMVFASARPVRDQAGVLADLFPDALRIGANGAMAEVHGELRVLEAFESAQRDRILAVLDGDGAQFVADGAWDYAHNLPDDHVFLGRIDSHGRAKRVPLEELDSILKLAVLDHHDAAQLTASLVGCGCAVTTHRAEAHLDVAPAGVDKRTALERLGINEYVAYGNDLNDRRLLSGADYAVGVGSGDGIHDVTHRRLTADPGVVAASISALVAGRRPRD
ncbi:Cof-type HAD-IIB family hydrolase [Microbacterium sp. SSW1-49]|uniref:Cof-type HAD-IIB family hydrolase n=1 Tax=Microbacterium croceum TaxID=2851645 RepID=A0ABT0FG30_9MICO|nr:HAD family hydrolase [Microbacterium croceum]MCK2037026.1 Cof-type HAD-IIB family hydrolase [Microbacterium croceum]